MRPFQQDLLIQEKYKKKDKSVVSVDVVESRPSYNHIKVTYESGLVRWFIEHDSGEKIPHRLDGPAIEWADGDGWWFVNGHRHRLDGPAVERADGTGEWWYEDVKIDVSSQEEFVEFLKLLEIKRIHDS